jgi:DNA-binding response OmpR family regulator
MRIKLKVVGDNLFSLLSASRTPDCGAFPELYEKQHVDWELTLIDRDLTAEELVTVPDSPDVVLVSGDRISSLSELERIQAATPTFHHFRSGSSLRAPLLMVFNSWSSLKTVQELPEVVSDWVVSPVCVPDLVRRIIRSLKRQRLIGATVTFGPLMLSRSDHKVSYGPKTFKLAPSESMLLEIFMDHAGSVVSFDRLVSIFLEAGKSAEPNNIRVAMFQLRLKLEMLTRSNITLTNIYKQGYCLRHRTPTHEMDII